MMKTFIFVFFVVAQAGSINVTQSVSLPKVLQKDVLTQEEVEALDNTVSGMYMGVSNDSNYVYINERGIKVDKKVFNFKDLPPYGSDIYIRCEVREKQKIGIFCSTNLDEAVYFKKGLFK